MRTSVLTDVVDHDLFRSLNEAGPGERERVHAEIVRRHAGLVHWLAGRYTNPAVEYQELVQVGYVGLMLAIKRFDPERGSDFTSFARPTVQGEIRRYFRDKRRWIRLPRRLQELQAEIKPAMEKLTHELGRSPTVPELAHRLAVDEEIILEALTADDGFSHLSLDAPVGTDGETTLTLADTIGADDSRFDLMVDGIAVRPLIAALPGRDQHVLHLRFFEGLTQAEIGKVIGVSQMQVSRILARILSEIRAQLAASAA